jgi:hypothetical protein
MPAPIALFVYNRPEHTRQTLEALSNAELAKNSVLYIFADGKKEDDNDINAAKIDAVRQLIKEQKWCKESIIIERDQNCGLAHNIIQGVSYVIDLHESVIVLEDDMVVANGFLQYMNTALELYKHDEKVGCIHAWNYKMNTSKNTATTFFLKGADCWGWATWKRAWQYFEPNGKLLLDKIIETQGQFEFNRKNTHEFVNMLKDQVEGKNNSWAIRWHASLFLKNMLCLHPNIPLLLNIGLDNSGTHCGDKVYEQQPQNQIELTKIEIKEADWFFESFKETLVKPKIEPTKWQQLKSILKHFFHL